MCAKRVFSVIVLLYPEGHGLNQHTDSQSILTSIISAWNFLHLKSLDTIGNSSK